MIGWRHRLAWAVLSRVRTVGAEAHDFWLQPDSYRIEPDVAVPLTLQVGHGPFRQRSPLPVRRITRFEAITPQGSAVDLRGNLHPGHPTEDGELQFRSRAPMLWCWKP